MSLARTVLLAAMAFFSQSCFSARYLAQAARGQAGILAAARPIPDVIADPATPLEARRLLELVRGVKEWGIEQGLRPTRSYERYADVRRAAAAWIVQASPALSLEPRRWRFPIAGSVPYLGFFDEDAARRYAADLARSEGLDVHVRTASAYSTLGWFRDPVLSTMLRPGDAGPGDLADVVLHESVHATVYVKDQSAFNESLASFVADRLTPAWLDTAFGAGSAQARAWAEAQAAGRARAARLHRAYEDLDALYHSPAPGDAKLARKAELLAALQADLGGSRPLNNAALAGFRTYDTGSGAFERLLAAAGGSWRAFLDAVSTLQPEDFGRPQAERFDEAIEKLAARQTLRAGGPRPPSGTGGKAGPATG
ncbi:MAG TPA: aminopeptidase [Anaeromyxobacteraceae bacterium]|nr:aminopeptidase [Anaeromyxobacteraceae bacterium]